MGRKLRAQVNPNGNKGWSTVAIVGPEGKAYWFPSEKLAPTSCGSRNCRFTKKDENETAGEYERKAVTDEITVGSLYSDSVQTGMTDVSEYAFEQWYYRRLITIGDAAHKVRA